MKPAKTLGEALERAVQDEAGFEMYLIAEIRNAMNSVYRDTGWGRAHVRQVAREAVRLWLPPA